MGLAALTTKPTRKKTQTLGHDLENPSHTIFMGHVGPETFTKAFAAEGWSTEEDEFIDGDLTYEYWVKKGSGFKKSNPENPKAKPVTVFTW